MNDGKTQRPIAVVTGGARGIGKGCAEALGRRGFDLVLVDVLEGELASTVEGFRGSGVAARGFIADVADHGRAREVTGEVLEGRAAIDVLVNNAGTPMPKGLLEIEEHEWDRTIDVHMKGCFNWCRAVAPSMLASGAGRIINVSSVSAHSGGVTRAVSKFAYAGAKAGILGMTRALAKELGPAVSVNAICPGAIATELTASMLEERSAEFIGGICLGRLGTPADIGEVAAFLATVEPNYITGQAITVDGFQWAV